MLIFALTCTVRSMKGDWRGALRVRALMRRNRAPLTVHVYNALLAACERARQWCAHCAVTCTFRPGSEIETAQLCLLPALAQ